MGKSQLLKDLVTSDETLETVLLRLKVILSDLNNEAILNWVEGELKGYDDLDTIPKYRITKGNPVGTYILNYNVQYTNQVVPLDLLIGKEHKNKITTVPIKQSISAIQNVASNDDSNYVYPVPPSFCYKISTEEIQLGKMEIQVSSILLDGIISNVKSKLVDVIMELEKEFNNLDHLDISNQIKEKPQKTKKVIFNIEKIIFGNSIEIGDNNKIAKSDISLVEEQESNDS